MLFIIGLMQKNSDDIYQPKIAMTDGVCQWKLSEFNLGKEYIDMKRLGKERVSGIVVGQRFH